MPTLQELLNSGALTSGAGQISAMSGRNSIANLLNQGVGYVGGSGLDMPGYVYKSLGKLPQLYLREGYIEGGETPAQRYTDPTALSYADALARNWRDVNVQTQPDSENPQGGYRNVANIGDVMDVAGLQSPALRNWLAGRATSGGLTGDYGAYIPEAAYNSLLNDLSGYNAADESAFNTNAMMALATVISAGTINNMYGAGASTTAGTEGATTYGIGESPGTAYGTDLSAADAFNAGDIFYGSGPTAETGGGFLTGMGEAGAGGAYTGPASSGGLFGNTTLETAIPGIPGTGGAASTASAAGTGGGMFETLKEWFPYINAGSSLVSGLLGYGAAGDAADAQREGAAGATAEARRQFDTVRADTAPYRAAGVQSLDALGKLLGLVPGYSPESELIKTPGYQFRLDQGNEALTNLQAKGGYRLGGRAVKEAMRYNQDYATGEYGNAVDRLFRLGGFGTSGVGTSASAGANAANIGANASMYAGNAGATGAYGQASAINNAIQGGLQNYLTWDMYNRFAAR